MTSLTISRSKPWRRSSRVQVLAIVMGFGSTYIPTVLAQLGGDQPSAKEILLYKTVVGSVGIIVMVLLLKVLCGESIRDLNLRAGAWWKDILLGAGRRSDGVHLRVVSETRPGPDLRAITLDRRTAVGQIIAKVLSNWLYLVALAAAALPAAIVMQLTGMLTPLRVDPRSARAPAERMRSVPSRFIRQVGHSMSGLSALAYAVDRPERTRRLVLITSLSGFPAAARWGFPGSAFRIYEPDFWRVIFWGIRLNGGRGNLALHHKLENLMGRASYYDKSLFTPVEIDPDDRTKGVPIRTIWSKNMYARLSCADRLDEVRAPTLVLAGRHDPEAPLECSEELVDGIPDASLVIFEQSGHSPFIEEPSLSARTVESFYEE